MGKGFNNDPSKDKYKKTKFSREKTFVQSEEDQAINDERLAREKEAREKERASNLSLAQSKAVLNNEDYDSGEQTPVPPRKREEKSFSTTYMESKDEE